MRCVTCKEPLVVLELDDVEVDYCLACHGLWLDEGELEILLGDHEAAIRFLNSLTPATTEEKTRKCPICDKKMKKVTYGNTPAITIDECIEEDGIWCDAGELSALLKGVENEGKVSELLRDLFQH